MFLEDPHFATLSSHTFILFLFPPILQSPDSVSAIDVGFHSKSQRAYTTGMPDRGADLVAWVVGEYGSVASYTEAELANHFTITVKGKPGSGLLLHHVQGPLGYRV